MKGTKLDTDFHDAHCWVQFPECYRLAWIVEVL